MSSSGLQTWGCQFPPPLPPAAPVMDVSVLEDAASGGELVVSAARGNVWHSSVPCGKKDSEA